MRGWIVDQSLDGITRRIATAFDRNSRTPQAQFPITAETRDEEYGNGLITRVRTISRRDRDRSVPAFDVYEFDYANALLGPNQRRHFLSQGGLMLLAILVNTPRLLRALLSRSGKTSIEMFQVLYVLGVLVLFAVYAALLLMTAAATLEKVAVGKLHIPVLARMQDLVVILTGLGLLVPPKFRESITAAAADFLSVVYYVGFGRGRDATTGQLTALLEHIAEKEGGGYRQVHLIGYSFGTIVGLDTLFPFRQPFKRLSMVDTLVTIGCPFDLLRTIWPEYFGGRRALPGTPRRWLNVYSPIDVLGSNFRDKTGVGIVPDQSEAAAVPPESILYADRDDMRSLSFLSTLVLMGLRAHSMYWGSDFESEASCFDPLVARMYEDDPLLQ